MKYSRPYKCSGRLFRFDYDRCIVELIEKPDAEMIADNAEWQEKYGKDLWHIKEGYLVLDSAGLSLDSWKNVETRKECLGMWAAEIDEEVAYLTRNYLMYG